MGVNSLPKTVTRERRDCDLNPGPSVPESSTLTTQLPSSWYTSTPGLVLILTYNDRTVTHLHIKWGVAAGPGAARGCRASAGANRPAGPGYGLREIQGRVSSGGAASNP